MSQAYVVAAAAAAAAVAVGVGAVVAGQSWQPSTSVIGFFPVGST